VIDHLNLYLEELVRQRNVANEIEEINNQNEHVDIEIPNFVGRTISNLRQNGTLPANRNHIDFRTLLDRRDGCDRPVPNVTLKVPTAGGKTFLAVQSLERILGCYLNQNTGFVLWVVPNDAIYTQTLRNLNDRTHLYRQTLDNISAGNTMILERTSPFSAADVENNLCVMVVMLQATNRQTRESLRMFRDRGDVHDFFPAEGEMELHEQLHQSIPNLDIYNHNYTLIKQSLGNALRLIRPIVVVDEGHKATSNLAHSTIYGFNPSFVLELTATPKDIQPTGGQSPTPGRYANILVEITGREVDNEGMIKMPINLNPMQGNDWINTLSTSLTHLNELDIHAQRFESDSGRYIRPIMLVQVEATGPGVFAEGTIHSDDVRAQLIQLGLSEDEIAVKSAYENDLGDPENQNLSDRNNRIRVIITMRALQEGWNCPFAYVICALAATSNLTAMTQLIGRILRQPGASKTGVSQLDQCYIFTHRADTVEVVRSVRQSLESEGLGDLSLQVAGADNQGYNGNPTREINRRGNFIDTEIYLPRVLRVRDNVLRELDYETDILSEIDWNDIDLSHLIADIPSNLQRTQGQMQRIGLDDNGNIVNTVVGENTENLIFNRAYATRAISDIVPNSFVAYDIVNRLTEGLLNREGFDNSYIGQQMNLIIERLRTYLRCQRDIFAEDIFRNGLVEGHIQFRLRADGRNWRMPNTDDTAQPEGSMPLLNNLMRPVSSSLFETVYHDDLNEEERGVALFLDSNDTIQWWHRNVARQQYGIQGWLKNKMYPDFIFAIQQEGTVCSVRVLETKGDHLDNLDTDYKRCVLEVLSEHFSFESVTEVGECLIQDDGLDIQARLILFGDIAADLPNWILLQE